MMEQPSSSGVEYPAKRESDFNPYAAPRHATIPETEHASGDDETIRKKYLSAEANIQSLGSLYCLAAIFAGVACVMNLYSVFGVRRGVVIPEVMQSMMLMAGMMFLFSVLYAGTGMGLRRQKVWSRWVATVFSAIGLIAFPVGTIFAALFLYILWSRKANYVFRPEYQRVIAATPHIKYRTSIVVWILLGILVVFSLLMVGSVFFAGR